VYKPKVLALARKKSGVTYHRIETPLRHLQEGGYIDLQIIYDFNEISIETFGGVTHFIASRFIPSKQILHVFQFLKSKGIKVIIDQDDHWDLPNYHPSKKLYDRFMKLWIQLSNQYADEVWVTHKELAKHIQNKNVKIVPNAINHHDKQWQHEKIKSESLRFGYVGGISHKEDLLSTKLDFKGSENSYCVKVDTYPEILNVGNVLEPKDVDEYATLYSHFDVSLIPLRASKFNRCKSNLKMLEAGFTGTAAIVSHTHPYTQVIESDNCVSVPAGWSWEKAIKNINKEQAQELAENLREDVWDYRMDKINEIRHDLLYANDRRDCRKAC
jgi:glycosyltransferase involved in cell wall biosynthesis